MKDQKKPKFTRLAEFRPRKEFLPKRLIGRIPMEFVLDAYCGLYCGACPNLLAAKAGIWNEPCHGCKSEQTVGYCATCEIKICAESKGHEFCHQCSTFKKCALIHKFAPAAEKSCQQRVLSNMEQIRMEGKAKWLEEQENSWRCGNCGTLFSWSHKTCSRCGQAVVSAPTE